ncbi:unnamed protein product [Withania somnifera]
MAEVKLLGSPLSPFSCRVEWALNIKGVEYQFVKEDVRNKSPLLLESNPVHKKIPILIHNGKPICESMIIVEYIDEVFEGPSILPKDPYNRAVARFWVKFFDDTCIAVLAKVLFGKGEEVEKSKEEFGELLKILDNELKDKLFFVGDNFGFADIAANFMAFWLEILEEAAGIVLVKSENFPNFCAWRDNYINSSQVQEHLPPKDVLLAHLQSRVQAAAAPK